MHDAVREAVSRARAGEGPSLIDVRFERFNPHEEGIKDTHRLAEHVAWLKENKDPITLFRTRVTESGEIEGGQLDAIDAEVGALIEEAVTEAKAAPPISVDQLLTDMYVSY